MLDFDWRQARDDFSVNALSSLVLLSRLAPRMAERGGGHVTAIASLAALSGLPYEAAYSGSKAALVNIVESARAELGPRGVTFTTVFPGFVDTEMFRAQRLQAHLLDPRARCRGAHLPRLARAPARARLPGPRVREGGDREARAGADPRPPRAPGDAPARRVR